MGTHFSASFQCSPERYFSAPRRWAMLGDGLSAPVFFLWDKPTKINAALPSMISYGLQS